MTWRFAGIDFDQMHQHSNLSHVVDHPDADLVGVCDPDPSTSTGSLPDTVESLSIPDAAVYDDEAVLLETTDPDVVMGCPRNSEHANFVERMADYDVHVVIEKPMAATLEDADRMIAAMDDSDGELFVNWPSMWNPTAHAVRDLIQSGEIGDVLELQYTGGNAGAPPAGSWFYDPDSGGGSMLDYLGYGTTFSTWFRDGDLPERVYANAHVPADASTDFQSATTCEYERGIAVLQTTWRMIEHPWEAPSIPAKGYEIVGTDGAITTREQDVPIRLQTAESPAGRSIDPEPLDDEFADIVAYVVDRLDADADPEGPADPAFCREVQRIIETARQSVEAGESLPLVE